MNKHHKIQRQVMEVTTMDPSAGIGFEREVRDVYLYDLLPRMEALFDRYSGGQNHIRTGKLEIDITLPWSKSWQENFCDAVLRELENALRSAVAVRQDLHNPGVPEWVVARGDEQEVFFYFLANGTLPWYADPQMLPRLEEWLSRVSGGEAPSRGSLLEAGSFFNRVVRLLAGDRQAIHRWLSQFGEETLKVFFADTVEYRFVDRWASRISLLSGADQAPARWEVIFSFLARNAGASGPGWTEAGMFLRLWNQLPEKTRERWWKEECGVAVREEIIALLGSKPATGDASLPSGDRGDSRPDLQREPTGRANEEGIFVENAGLVLLHPFLAPLFTALEWWGGARFASPDLHRRAVLLTQYMVCPGEEFPEHQLLLNKVLCGFEPGETLPAELIAAEREIAEANELLEAVIGHWKMNGRAVFTTVENLRGSFLQRTGKLSRRSSGDWLLQVEGKGYDIVLNGLPWGIGMIRHKWMPDMLRVEWGHG